jgi:hypothetical protein
VAFPRSSALETNQSDRVIGMQPFAIFDSRRTCALPLAASLRLMAMEGFGGKRDASIQARGRKSAEAVVDSSTLERPVWAAQLTIG